ncbi:D-alanyl-D-alanine carboxypeptidase [Candidatus Gottesmanbacteria bacterium]|nr:D-alanyl-D-alanine carboxypeptidase [Candidatus Gottesmanbacteria bacterium]
MVPNDLLNIIFNKFLKLGHQQKKKKRKITKAVIINSLKQHTPRFFGFFLVAGLLFLFPAPNSYFKQVAKNNPLILSKDIQLPSPPAYPVSISDQVPPKTTAGSVLIQDLASGVILYAKNENERFLLASTTKIITALVALDYYQLEDVLTVKTVMNTGRNMGLVKGEQLTFESLLYGTLVHSANDAAYTLAENYPGGINNFIETMNKKAASLYLLNTHFTNPVGFDDENQYTTASDLAKLAKVSLNDKTLAKIVGTRNITVSDISYTYFHPLINVNELLGRIPGVAGVKTGFTQNAGEILVSNVKKNDKSVIFVVLRSKDRFGETAALIDWVFGNFFWMPFDNIIPTIQMQQQASMPQNHYLPQTHK